MCERLQKKGLFVLLATFVFGLTAHAFIFFNPSFSHDSLLVEQFSVNGGEPQIALGRYLQPLYRLMRGEITATWLVGVISLLFLACAIFLILEIAVINSARGIILSCGVLTTNLTLVFSYATYSPWADVYMLALLCGVSAVYVSHTYRYGVIAGAFLIMLSLALYQAYIMSAVAVLLLSTVRDILDNTRAKAILYKLTRGGFMLALGGIFYFISLKIVFLITHIPLAETANGINGVGDFSDYTLSAVLALAWQSAVFFIKEILRWGTIYSRPTTLAVWGLFILSAIHIFLLIQQRKLKPAKIAALMLLIVTLPVSLNGIYILSKGMIHSLMTYSVYFIYILVVLVFEYEVKMYSPIYPPPNFCQL